MREKTGFFDAMVEYASCLKRFDREMSLGIYDAGHEQLRLAAEQLPIAYKPCGAGGGDVGVAISMDDEALLRFDELASRTGAARLNVGIDRTGLLVEEGGT